MLHLVPVFYLQKTHNPMKKIIFLLFCLLSACTSIPEGIEPISDFDVSRYIGKWYEIARLENRFERGLKEITAEYSLRDDGGLKVLNSGVRIDSGKREFAEGKAYFIDKPDVGSLKVSFFGPFYGGYHIIELDKDYRYVMISGSDRDYLWILAREPKLDVAVLQGLIGKAKQLGFNTEKLLYPEQ
jgi:apolipoprotein D and lipocalin family protein